MGIKIFRKNLIPISYFSILNELVLIL